MDTETLTNHISRLGKHFFENACKIVIKEIFNSTPVNVDGIDDGGTDFIEFSRDGARKPVAYQITTQKTDIKNKAYKDAQKVIKKLNASKFFFLTTLSLSETDSRKLENEIETALNISTTCLGARHIADLILSENLLNRFLDETNYPLPRNISTADFDYREVALHSYTLFSKDAADMKEGIYDDSILFILSNDGAQHEEELILKVLAFLSLPEAKFENIRRRIGALFGKRLLKKNKEQLIILSDESKNDLIQRKRIYEQELLNLSAAQIDLMRTEFNVNWNLEDSKRISIWIADAFIAEQLITLKEAKASIISNPIFNIDENGKTKLFKFLEKQKELPPEKVKECAEQLLEIASHHPLISKIIRASVYIALEGGNPISSAKALGANRWSDFNILIEPTVAIPYICSQLSSTYVNRYHQMNVMALNRAKKLDIRLFITHYYINECAGHLLNARKYDNISFDENELQYSNNAFVSTYYTYKRKKVKIPETLLDYLGLFSSSIFTYNEDKKKWVRSIMTDIQSLLNKGNVEFLETPQYSDLETEDYEVEYTDILTEFNRKKKQHLINDDVWALKVTNDRIIRKKEHWIILTYDRAMISFAKNEKYNGWITNPYRFLDFTEFSNPLSENQFVSLVHSVASYSEATLAAGARIIDKIILYASKEMQNWEFKKEIEKFKKELLQTINLYSESAFEEVDKQTNDFLLSHGIEITEFDDEVDDDLGG